MPVARIRRPQAAIRNADQLDVWLESPELPSHHSPTQQPQVSFPQSANTQSPYLQPSPSLSTANYSPSFSPKNSPGFGSHSPISDNGINWRESEKAALPKNRRKAEKKAVLVRQVAWGAGTLIVLVNLYFLARLALRGDQVAVDILHEEPPRQSGLKKVLGRKSASFRDQLSPAVQYITTPNQGSLANQFMSMYHLTYLAGVLYRVPILPPFYIPSSTLGPAVSYPVSHIFDMNRFAANVNVTALDWIDVRPQEDAVMEQLGCWTSSAVADSDLEMRAVSMRKNGLDPSFFPLRMQTPPRQGNSRRMNDLQVAFNFLASFDADDSAKTGLIDQALHSSSVTTYSNNAHKKPDHQMFCVDSSLFHTVSPASPQSTTHLDQYEHTAFRLQGQHLRFTQELEEVAGDVISFLLGARAPFVAVHIAAEADCRADVKALHCVHSLKRYISSLEKVKILAGIAGGRKSREHRHNVRALSVIASTDITDIGFLGEIVNLGWTLLDPADQELRPKYQHFAPDLIQSVVHSKAAGFVGTKGCSPSTLGALRVRQWRGGPVELV